MNEFGGNWTENKIEILIEYAKAYLTIMNINASKYNWDLLYFDGFAGSGQIQGDDNTSTTIVGAARRILEIKDPRSFDLYYFVEKEKRYADILRHKTIPFYPNKKIHVVNEDCNVKIESLSRFLSNNGKRFKALAYIDPCGMQLNWKSLQTLEKHSVDVWILVPTGMGVNRLLKNDGNISDAYSSKLEQFLGMSRQEIFSFFYKESQVLTLFGEETITTKEQNAIDKSAELYKERLKTLFKFVSEPYVLKNKMNSVMFHFFMASNNKNALRIANQIIKKYNNLNY
ncbi:three-Cys-motif partner protein TcmP [Chryseobacterium aquaticum]|uniref:Three-Cys-motif partner protein TcmP n=1 Tax=Chryseobacterium aquaticum subsp. greenlandense TaxID=345663 RepID=A0A101CGS5_9FLAO|nr:three-Cys-motif partner protein TcmP [Chryseobacterium aquaticum]KUJ55972.1 hypothetical protein AR686_10200 [Chryseobacterium aquaticum subsp. greenlandense]